jgi:hypothetical protein
MQSTKTPKAKQIHMQIENPIKAKQIHVQIDHLSLNKHQTPNKVMQVHVQKDCPSIQETRGVSCYGLAIYMKMYLKAKEELWKLKYFNMQKHNLQKSL